MGHLAYSNPNIYPIDEANSNSELRRKLLASQRRYAAIVAGMGPQLRTVRGCGSAQLQINWQTTIFHHTLHHYSAFAQKQLYNVFDGPLTDGSSNVIRTTHP